MSPSKETPAMDFGGCRGAFANTELKKSSMS